VDSFVRREIRLVYAICQCYCEWRGRVAEAVSGYLIYVIFYAIECQFILQYLC